MSCLSQEQLEACSLKELKGLASARGLSAIGRIKAPIIQSILKHELQNMQRDNNNIEITQDNMQENHNNINTSDSNNETLIAQLKLMSDQLKNLQQQQQVMATNNMIPQTQVQAKVEHEQLQEIFQNMTKSTETKNVKTIQSELASGSC